ncbi:thiamine pyrophosphate-binding protein [Pigmentiphaga kullae]|uniref:3D-(3,5/4)-trihydroxycyclohexane-1,2-dione acylhydrolase (Decyclizing) n=1 Tax=Pigmentiphaga kullae TaxID=151784 RepID=A0A4Q7N7D9_9BURK|nr:thiamine pyrophosphate-dependent enzyme [Pigmentiphaga kullae]RZS77956.1 3D-(3,5/4)-trihydroxycyclohexane-1,2-dione acylhydrolase (decyclizing) [Pigmentiphaga kullae]
MNQTVDLPRTQLPDAAGMQARAAAIARAGGLQEALEHGLLSQRVSVSLSEALVLGLLRQGVSKYLAIFGHGSTDLGEVLRVYTEAGVTRVFNFRNEVEMAHAGTALAWIHGETCVVVTSIGPGALQAMAGSLAAASNGVGLYHVYGDETTHGEGYNMQQVPRPVQHVYGQMTALMGDSYVLHTPEALRDALRRGTRRVHHPVKPGPFYLLLPLNTQPQRIEQLNLVALPERLRVARQAVADHEAIEEAAVLLRKYDRIVVKAGGGARAHAAAVRRLVEATGAVAVLSPGSTGVLPDAHPQNMHVGGSKGSISGNHAMEHAELLVVIGSRAVCQSDCSGTGYPRARAVININGDLDDVAHYNRTLGLHGDIGAVLEQLLSALVVVRDTSLGRQDWLDECAAAKRAWKDFLASRQNLGGLRDEVWNGIVLTQPEAIKIVADFARDIDAVKLFDAGDVQANGFQTVEDDTPFQTYTESGASYMGFATCAVVASGLAARPRYAVAFTGDGSFMMNPQALISAVEHGASGMIVIFDNRRMAAISSLQHAQYGVDFRTSDGVAVDYVAMARAVRGVNAVWGGHTARSLQQALREAHAHQGLSVVHVPVYAGSDERGGLGAYGSWNVGNWCEQVQRRYRSMDI